MSRIVYIVFLGMLVGVQACSSPDPSSQSVEEHNSVSSKGVEENKAFTRAMMVELLYEEGPDIVAIAQSELLKNVGKAMQAGGPTHAVDFCNIHASGIMDSLSNELKVSISRVSDKNRNPDQAANEDEKALITFFAQNKGIKDSLINDTYYKPIVLGIPTCLQCHGKPHTDIDKETLSIISERYPNDLAQEYSLGDIRGMWKLRLQEK